MNDERADSEVPSGLKFLREAGIWVMVPFTRGPTCTRPPAWRNDRWKTLTRVAS